MLRRKNGEQKVAKLVQREIDLTNEVGQQEQHLHADQSGLGDCVCVRWLTLDLQLSGSAQPL